MNSGLPHPFHKLPIQDIAFYRQAKIALLDWAIQTLERHAVQAVVLDSRPGMARLMNLVAWHPDHRLEYLDRPQTTGDLTIHVALHQAVHHYFGKETTAFRILGEALASASDLYLVGLFAQAGMEPPFLEETLESFTFYFESYGDVQHLEALLGEWVDNPYPSMVKLARFLYFSTKELLGLDPQKYPSLPALIHSPFYPLVHHYHLANWVFMLGKDQHFTDESERAAEALFQKLESSENALCQLLQGRLRDD